MDNVTKKETVLSHKEDTPLPLEFEGRVKNHLSLGLKVALPNYQSVSILYSAEQYSDDTWPAKDDAFEELYRKIDARLEAFYKKYNGELEVDLENV